MKKPELREGRAWTITWKRILIPADGCIYTFRYEWPPPPFLDEWSNPVWFVLNSTIYYSEFLQMWISGIRTNLFYSHTCVSWGFLNCWIIIWIVQISKIPNNTCSHPNIQNDLYYQVMSRRITYDYCDYLRSIIQKHENLIWLVTYLHVLLIIKRNIKIQINGIEMILLWYNNKYNKYVCTVDIYIYIYTSDN